jgi:subtilisin family serine protease
VEEIRVPGGKTRSAASPLSTYALRRAVETEYCAPGDKAARAAGAEKGAARILYVHGIGNKPVASVLKCQWDTALFGFDLGERSRLAYWVNRERYPVPESGSCSSGDLSDGADSTAPRDIAALDLDPSSWLEQEIAALTADRQEMALLRRLADHALLQAGAGPSARSAEAKVLPLPASLRRWITRRLTRAFLKDVHDLFFVPERREIMLDSVRKRLEVDGGPFIVIGHSQGSMIAYLALSLLDLPGIKVPLFITVGSPLGLAEVRDQLKKILGVKKLAAPAMAERWINVADRLDPVALDASLANDYGKAVDFLVLNPDSPRHPHSATGYLRTEPVQRAVRDAVDVALFQPVGSFVIARDMARALENAPAEKRHEVLIELAELGEPQRPLDEVRDTVLGAIRELRRGRGTDGVSHDEDYAVEALARFVSARLTREETEILAVSLGDPATRAIRRIWKNAQKKALIEKSINTLQVRPAHNAYRAYGENIHWAVLDSGIADDHPHFLDAQGKPRSIVATYDCTRTGALKPGPAPDGHGHGTHVAGIIAGRHDIGGRTLSGMAPDARLHVYKVLDDIGQGKDSWIIKALDHISRTNEEAGRLVIHGVNLSLGGPFDPSAYACGHSPLCRELRRLWRQGVLVVIAAGNEGYTLLETEEGEIQANMPLTIGDPANLEEAIVVGSVHKESPHLYGGSYFSSRGPTADGRQKPDVVAPGERILSCRHKPVGKKQAVEELYVEMSGTSMAAPHVSGQLAAFLSIHGEFIGYPDKVKDMLLASCTDLGRERAQQGAGLPNLVKMLVAS